VPRTSPDPATPGPNLLELAGRARPLSLAAEQVLEVDPAVATVLPDGGLRCGTTVLVGDGLVGDGLVGDGGGLGATSLMLSLLALPTSQGRWCAVVGLPALGPAAAEELDVDLTHLALVPAPGRQWATVTAALLDGLDVVVVRPPHPVRPPEARRLTARARHRRAVLVVLSSSSGPSVVTPPGAGSVPKGPDLRLSATGWPGPDLCLAVTGSEWHGPGAGFGHLQGRRMDLLVWGRGAAARAAHRLLWLPAAEGGARSDVSADPAVPAAADPVVPAAAGGAVPVGSRVSTALAQPAVG
jgi:hypothetical protein